jgi:uncharacterized protein YukE
MEGNEELQGTLEASNKELKESNKELRESNRKFQKVIENKLQKLQENMKADIKLETENLIERFKRENQKLNNQFGGKLNSEIRSVSHKVSQVRKEVDVELRAAKKNIDTVKENLDRKLNQQTSQTNIATD